MEAHGSAARKLRFLLNQQADDAHQMAKRLGIELQTLLDLLDDKSRPTNVMLQKICSVYGLNIIFRESFVQKPATIAGAAPADPKEAVPPVELGPPRKPGSSIFKPAPRKGSSPQELKTRERAFEDEIVNRQTRDTQK